MLKKLRQCEEYGDLVPCEDGECGDFCYLEEAEAEILKRDKMLKLMIVDEGTARSCNTREDPICRLCLNVGVKEDHMHDRCHDAIEKHYRKRVEDKTYDPVY